MKKLLFLTVFMCLTASVGFCAAASARQTGIASRSSKRRRLRACRLSTKAECSDLAERVDGTLKMDDANSRLVFYGKDGKELFGIPYDALLVIYPQSKSVTSTTGNVVSHVPLPGAGLAGFIKEKRQYMIVQFDDPDMDAKGTVNFKFDKKEVLDSVIQALADKAALQQRGDALLQAQIDQDL